jgi:predicted TIM-barrel enzyme
MLMNAPHSRAWIAATWPPSERQDTECLHSEHLRSEGEWIFCPWLQGLPRRSNLWIASLPIHDANAALLDAVASDAFRNSPVKPAFAGVCLVDPFRQMKQIFQTIMAAGISGVVNLPTTGAFRGSMAQALDDLGTGVNREITMLALARDYGLRIGGVATTQETGSKMTDIGCDFVLLLKHETLQQCDH